MHRMPEAAAGASGRPPSVVLHDVCVRRGRRVIVGPASLALEGPGLTRLAGDNGSGKTTLLRVMAGLQRPSAGRVDATHAVGLLPERFAGAPELRVEQLLDTVRRAARSPVDPSWRDRVLSDLDVGPLLDRPLGGLSHGQSQRTALAAALHVRPPILLLDEPWDGLDTATGERLRELLLALAADALVVVTDHGPAGRSGATVELRVADGEVRRSALTDPPTSGPPSPADPPTPGPTAPADSPTPVPPAPTGGSVRWRTADGRTRSGRLTDAGAEALERLAAAGDVVLDDARDTGDAGGPGGPCAPGDAGGPGDPGDPGVPGGGLTAAPVAVPDGQAEPS